MNRTFSDSPNFQSQNFQDVLFLGNLASGGSIGTAAATVDQYQGCSIAQSTGGQAITIPAPTGNTPKSFYVVNTGSVSFTLLGQTVPVGSMMMCVFTGVNIPNHGYVWSPSFNYVATTTTTTTTV